MKEYVQEVLNSGKFTDTSGRWISQDNLVILSENIVNECIEAVKNTDLRHAYTTYDRSLIEATVERSVQSIKDKFGIKTYG